MPTKLNRAGQQQNYVPQGNGDASGEYADHASGSNKHFTNFKKPENQKLEQKSLKQEPNIGVQIKDTGEQPADTSAIKSKYDGKGKQVLAESLQKKLNKGPNGKLLLEAISGADDELSGIIGDFYNANPKIEIKLGKNLNSKYETTSFFNYWTGAKSYSFAVSLGQGVLKEQGYYSKGGVFFHESGHALDASYINEGGMKDEWSYSYISKKYGQPMRKMVKEEIRTFKDNYAEIKEKIKLEQEELTNKFFGVEEQKELDIVREKLKAAYQHLDKDEGNVALKNKQNKIIDEIVTIKNEWFKDYNNPEKKAAYFNKQQELKNSTAELSDYQNKFYAKNYPDKEQISKRENELLDLKINAKAKAKEQICVKYGDLSDMFIAAGVGDLCGMGHTSHGYWTDRHVGNECFAEITSAKATNPASLELMKKYIPKTLEIYDEIMDQIRNKKNVYNKD